MFRKLFAFIRRIRDNRRKRRQARLNADIANCCYWEKKSDEVTFIPLGENEVIEPELPGDLVKLEFGPPADEPPGTRTTMVYKDGTLVKETFRRIVSKPTTIINGKLTRDIVPTLAHLLEAGIVVNEEIVETYDGHLCLVKGIGFSKSGTHISFMQAEDGSHFLV